MVSHPNRSTQPVTSIKGFNTDLTCRGFQFEVGKTYKVSGSIKACENGFHACPIEHHPLSVFEHYAPASSRFFEVTQDGKRDAEDNKLASASITVGVEITLGQLAERAVKWVFDRANWKEGPVASGDGEGVTASGTRGAATASGTRGAATASGYGGAATASGYGGAATASGYGGAATASGYGGAATASGTRGAATASGYGGKARGADGCALFLVHRDDNWKITKVWAGIVGEGDILPNTWYVLDADGVPQVALWHPARAVGSYSGWSAPRGQARGSERGD
jgi:hypothetical protein